MNWLSPRERHAIRSIACQRPDQETCGFVLQDGNVIEVENVAEDPVNQFEINPSDFAAWNDLVKGVWHSHLDLAGFSPLDQQVLMADVLPWAVYCLADDSFHECEFDTTAPLEGRPFVFGLYDCYSLVSDKLRELGVALPVWERGAWGEWNTPGFTPFDEQWSTVGKPVTDGQYREGDILLLNLGDHSGHTDHVGVFINSRQFLHHPSTGTSRIQTFGDYWSRRLNWVIRPNELWNRSEPSSC